MKWKRHSPDFSTSHIGPSGPFFFCFVIGRRKSCSGCDLRAPGGDHPNLCGAPGNAIERRGRRSLQTLSIRPSPSLFKSPGTYSAYGCLGDFPTTGGVPPMAAIGCLCTPPPLANRLGLSTNHPLVGSELLPGGGQLGGGYFLIRIWMTTYPYSGLEPF